MITNHPQARRALRNWTIASIIAVTAALAPIVRTDTIRFFRTVLVGSSPVAVVRADIKK